MKYPIQGMQLFVPNKEMWHTLNQRDVIILHTKVLILNMSQFEPRSFPQRKRMNTQSTKQTIFYKFIA